MSSRCGGRAPLFNLSFDQPLTWWFFVNLAVICIFVSRLEDDALLFYVHLPVERLPFINADSATRGISVDKVLSHLSPGTKPRLSRSPPF